MKKDFKIQRCLTVYQKNGNELIDEFSLAESDLSLHDLKEIFTPGNDDHLMYNQYVITEELSKLINEKIKFTFYFDKYEYFLETFSVDVDSHELNIRNKNH